MSVESPPPYSDSNPQQWAEDLIDYLIRQIAKKDTEIVELQDRVTALEVFHP